MSVAQLAGDVLDGRAGRQRGHPAERQLLAEPGHRRPDVAAATTAAPRPSRHPQKRADPHPWTLRAATAAQQSDIRRTWRAAVRGRLSHLATRVAGMSVRRVMGTEVEYGISVPGQPGANPMVTSSQVVNAYGARPELDRGGRARWDYEEESPLRDARGFTYSGAALRPGRGAGRRGPRPGQRDTDQRRPALRRPRPPGVLARPRCTNPLRRRAVGQGRRAGDGRGVPPRRDHPGHPADPALQEQHRQQGRQLRRARELPDAPADPVRRHRRAPHPVLRHPADRLRRRPGRHRPGRLAARASRSPSAPTSSRSRSGLETTLKRPIINTRDEPHSDADKYRRLHVIIGDANLSEISTYLKVGTTSLVLAMIEEKALTGDLGIADPVAELKAVSHDPSLTPPDAAARRPPADRAGPAVGVPTSGPGPLWTTGTAPTSTSRPPTCWTAGRACWTGSAATRCCAPTSWTGWPSCGCWRATGSGRTLGWASPKLQLVDLQYSDVRPEKGLYHRLVARGLDEDAARPRTRSRRAMVEPPEDTRAYFRGRCLAQYASEVVAASWDSVIFDVGPGVAGPGADDGARAGHQEARRCAVRQVPEREGPAGGDHRSGD